jgi:hypothetical protein
LSVSATGFCGSSPNSIFSSAARVVTIQTLYVRISVLALAFHFSFPILVVANYFHAFQLAT